MSKAEDPLINCPLDIVHRIRKSRMQTHLVKCLKNFKLGSSSKVKCPFNPLHIVETIELMHHCKSCPDSANVVLEQFETEGEKCFSGVISFEELQRQYDKVVPQNYEWEKYTINTPGYDPTANIENAPVYRSLNCESKSKRKEFRLRERQRFADLDNNKMNVPVPEGSPQVNKPIRPPYSNRQNEITLARTKLPAFITDEQTSGGTRSDVLETVKDKLETNQLEKSGMNDNSSPVPKENPNNQLDLKNQLKKPDDGSGTILNILDDTEVESITDVISQLNVLEEAEIAIKERKNKLINIMASTNASNFSGNSISYRDAALFQSSVAKNGIDEKKFPSTRMISKCAANFDSTGGQTGGEGASCSYKNARLQHAIAHSSGTRNQ